MKVLVTGGAGRVGEVVCAVLAQAGHDVTANDLRSPPDARRPIVPCDLLDRAAVAVLVKGHDAVVHLGAHASPRALPDAYRLYLENVTMTLHVFAEAIAAGIRKIVFASSIQVMHASLDPAFGRLGLPPAALPLDGEAPAHPSNLYGASKQTGESLLRHLADTHDLEAVAIRLPWTQPHWNDMQQFMQAHPESGNPDMRTAAFTSAEAGRLINAILRATLPGYRCYQPAQRANALGLPPDMVRQRYLSHLPLKQPGQPLECLVDLARITRETGWSPEF